MDSNNDYLSDIAEVDRNTLTNNQLLQLIAENGTGGGTIQELIGGDNIAIDDTDPAHPIINAIGSASNNASKRARGVLGLGLAPIASRYARYDFSGVGDGVNLTTNSKILYVPLKDSYVTRVAYYNSSDVTLTIAASKDQLRQVTFNNGATTATLLSKQWIVSDPISAKVLKGSNVYIYTFMSIVSGAYHFTHTISETGELAEKGVALTNKTMSGTITNSGGGTFGPVGLLFQLADNSVVVTGLGDSIMGGVGDAAAKSFVAKAFEGRKPCLFAQRAGETLQAYVNGTNVGSISTSDPLPASNSRYMLTEAANWVIGNYGINDVRANRTAIQIETDLSGLWLTLHNEGQKVTWCTVMPNSTSTDAWATTANQSVNATQNAQRILLNQWLRAGAPLNASTFAPVAVGTSGAILAGSSTHPLYKVIDTNSVVEDVVDNGKWKAPGFTTDGLHPSTSAHTACGAYIVSAMAADPLLFNS